MMADDFDRAKMVALYEAHNADKVGEVDALLEKYKTKRALMWDKLAQKYGQSAIAHAEAEAGRRVGSTPVEADTTKERTLPQPEASDASSAMAAFKKDFNSTLKAVAAAPPPPADLVEKPHDMAAFNRLKMTALYETHNPGKSGEVDKLLRKYEGKHALMWEKLAEKYGQGAIETADAAAAHAASGASSTAVAGLLHEPAEEHVKYVEHSEVKSEAAAKVKDGEADKAETALQVITTSAVDAQPNIVAKRGAVLGDNSQVADGGVEVGASSDTATFDRLKLVALYEAHNADKVNEVDKLLNKYGSMRTQMWDKLTQKYGADAIANAEEAASAATIASELTNNEAVREDADNDARNDSSLKEEHSSVEEVVIDEGFNDIASQGGYKDKEDNAAAPLLSTHLELHMAEESEPQSEHSTEEALSTSLEEGDTIETAVTSGVEEGVEQMALEDDQIEVKAAREIDETFSSAAPAAESTASEGVDIAFPQAPSDEDDPAGPDVYADDAPSADAVDVADAALVTTGRTEIVDTTGTDSVNATETAALGAPDVQVVDSAASNDTLLEDIKAPDAIDAVDTLDDPNFGSTDINAPNDVDTDSVTVAGTVAVDTKTGATVDDSIGGVSRALFTEAFEAVCPEAPQLNSKAFISLIKVLWAEANEVNKCNFALPGPRDLNAAFGMAVDDDSGTIDLVNFEWLWALVRANNGAAVRGLAGGFLTTIGIGRGRAKQERDTKRTAFEAAVRAAKSAAASQAEDGEVALGVLAPGTLMESTPPLESTEVTPENNTVGSLGTSGATKSAEGLNSIDRAHTSPTVTKSEESSSSPEPWVPKKQAAVPKRQTPKVRLTATQRVLTQRATAVRQFSELATDGSGSMALEQVVAGCALLRLPEADARRLFAQLSPHPEDMNCVYVEQFLDLWRQRAHVYFPVPISGSKMSSRIPELGEGTTTEGQGTIPPERFRSDLELQTQRSKGARAGFETENSRAKADWLARQRKQQNSQSRAAARKNTSLSPVSEAEAALVGAVQLGRSGLHIEEVGAAAVAADAWRPASSPRPLTMTQSSKATRAAGSQASTAAAPLFVPTRGTGGAPIGQAWMLAPNGTTDGILDVGSSGGNKSETSSYAGTSASAPRPVNSSLVKVSEARARVEAIRAKRLERERISGLYTRLGTEI